MSFFLSTLRSRAAIPLISRTSIAARFFSVSSSSRFNMAGKHEWMVILPDGPGKLSKRMEVRPDHLSAVKPKVQAGRITMGGAMLDEPIKEGEGPKINGSIFLVQADTKEEVTELIESDVYTSSGVWDLSKVQIIPFKSAVRTAL